LLPVWAAAEKAATERRRAIFFMRIHRSLARRRQIRPPRLARDGTVLYTTLPFAAFPRYNSFSVEPMQWAKAHFFVGSHGSATMRQAVTSKIEEIAQRVAESEGLEVVEVDVLGGGASRVVRIFIDKPAGVTHADCELVSQQVGTIMDVEDVVPGGRYTLEVSSPGLERKLTKPSDFERFQGRKVRVTLREPVENQRNFEGTLAGWDQGTVTLETGPGKSVRFPYEQVQKANLKFEW
jgi:ribosome maturation factor RimP